MQASVKVRRMQEQETRRRNPSVLRGKAASLIFVCSLPWGAFSQRRIYRPDSGSPGMKVIAVSIQMQPAR